MQSPAADLPSGEAKEPLHETSQSLSNHIPTSTTEHSSMTTSSTPNAKTVSKASAKTRQKNDKPVEVCHHNKVIARFRTQTECARYLRATPEAVSYHCGKGGGVCNGLFVRPVVATSSSSGEGSNSLRSGVYFGLFDGSSTHRPPARPQLSTEVVSTLKDWLLSPGHIDNPYPTGSEFDALMESTKLDRSQLKHWFNNARKRIWKPLVQSEGRLIPKFGKIGKRSCASGTKRGSDATTDDEDRSGAPDAAASSNFLPASATKGGGKHATSKRRKGNENPDKLAEGAATSLANRMNMCHSIGVQESFQRHQSDDSQYDSNSGNNFNMLMMNRYNQIFGNMGILSQGINSGFPMMGGNSMMNPSSMNHSMMMLDSTAGTLHNNGPTACNSFFGMGVSNNRSDGFVMSRGGEIPSFQGCVEVNDGTSSHGGMRSANGQESQYNANGNTTSYCQPLIQENPQGFQKKRSSVHSATLIESVRSNAVFKQQVASMAMNEASTSFKEMEDAFARSKEILAQVREETKTNSDEHYSPDVDDVRVMEANAHAKACQNTAMFKLKVSQRASEEAASAYNCYLRLVEDNDLTT